MPYTEARLQVTWDQAGTSKNASWILNQLLNSPQRVDHFHWIDLKPSWGHLSLHQLVRITLFIAASLGQHAVTAVYTLTCTAHTILCTLYIVHLCSDAQFSTVLQPLLDGVENLCLLGKQIMLIGLFLDRSLGQVLQGNRGFKSQQTCVIFVWPAFWELHGSLVKSTEQASKHSFVSFRRKIEPYNVIFNYVEA